MLYTIIINSLEGGVVDTIPSSNHSPLTQIIVEENTKLSLIAIPNPGYKFDSWEHCDIPNNNICCITIISDLTITARFIPISSYNLKINIIESGIVIYNSGEIFCTTTCTRVVPANTCLLLLAVPNYGYVLDTWIGCDICEDSQCIITVNQDREITAKFIKSYIFVVNVRGFGTVVDLVNEINCKVPTIYNIIENTLVRLTPIPDDGYQFDHWQECEYEYSKTCIHTVTSDKTITAIFIVRQCILTIFKDGDGFGVININGQDCESEICEYTFDNTSEITLLAKPSINSKFEKWTGCDTISYTFNISDNMTIYCTFSKLYCLHVEKTGSGIGFIIDTKNNIQCRNKCISYFNYNTNIKLVASPIYGSRFIGWTNCDTPIGNTCSISLTSDVLISAEFVKLCVLKIQVIGNGNVTLNGIICNSNSSRRFEFDINSSIEIISTPHANNIFSKLIGISDCLTGSGSFIIDSNKSIIVYFSKNIKFTINFTGIGYGKLIDSSGIINCEKKYIDYINNEYVFNIINCEYMIPEGTLLELTFIPSSCTNEISWNNCNMSESFRAVKIISGYTYTDYITINLSNEKYILSIIKEGTGIGIITTDLDSSINCGDTCYDEFYCSQKINLIATPDISSVFTGWKQIDNDGYYDSEKTITIIENTFAIAVFTIKTFTISIRIDGPGEGSVSNSKYEIYCVSNTTYTFDYGTYLNLIANPNYGSEFDVWDGDGTHISNNCSITITENITIIAKFKFRTYTLSVQIIFPGNLQLLSEGETLITSSPAGISSPSTNEYDFQFNKSISLRGLSGEICKFDKWVENLNIDINSNVCTFNMIKNLNVVAMYKLVQYKLKIIIVGSGSIEGTGFTCSTTCEMMFDFESNISLFGIPNEGYSFTSWNYNGTITTDTIMNIIMTDNITITVTFTIKKCTLTIQISSTAANTVYVSSSPSNISCNSIILTSSGEFDYNTPITLKATPTSNFDRWSNGLKSNPLVISLTSSQTLIAYFK